MKRDGSVYSQVRRLFMPVTLAVVASAAVIPARANLLAGQTVQVTYLFPNTSTIFAGPVDVSGPAGTASNFASFVNLSLSDTNILITTTRNAVQNNVAFDGLEFVDLSGNIPNFTNVSLDAATNYSGFTASRVTTSANTIFVNVEDLPGLQGQVISLDIGGSAGVPEPGSLILSGCALLALCSVFLRRRILG